MDNFQGYRIQETSVAKVNQILMSARQRVMAAQKEEFHRLFAREITTMADDITLKVIEAADRDIVLEAEALLRRKIAYASNRGYNSDYNFEANVSIVPAEDATYLMLYCPSPFIRDIFAETEGIVDYSTGDDVDVSEDENEARAKKWNELQAANNEENPLITKAFLTGQIEVDSKLLVFEPVKDRAATRARHQLMHVRLQMTAFGQEIPAAKLMQHIDDVLEQMLAEEATDEVQTLAAKMELVLQKISVNADGAITFGSLNNH